MLVSFALCKNEKILGVAKYFEDLEYLNQLADKGIDDAVLYILDKKIELQIKKRASIHINGIIARNYLLNEMK